MHIFRHYSFDLWLTLIRSDPAFKAQRVLYFCDRFNSQGRSEEEVTRIFRRVDLMCNAINERTGKNIDADEMYLMVISLMHDNDVDLHAVDTVSLYRDMDALLFDHMPALYSDDTLPVLRSLKARPGTTMNILSNTGFVKGATLRKVLEETGLAGFFDFQLYSDEEGMSKPSRTLFEKVIARAGALRGVSMMPGELVHIGDNAVADIQGARQAGIAAILINSGDLKISDLINHDQLIRTA